MDRGGAKIDTTDENAFQSSWTITLPADVRNNDSRLQAIARNLLQLPGVRSVTIDGESRLATVRLRPGRLAEVGAAEIPTHVFHESHADRAAGSDESSIISWVDPRDRSVSYIALPNSERGFKRALLLVAAALALALGLLGIVLPGLPTTPFVLVASYCLLRSSPRLHARLLHSQLFGGVLRDWHLHRGLRPHIRYIATAVIMLVLTASLVLTTMPLAAKMLVLAVAAIGIVYVWRLPSVAD